MSEPPIDREIGAPARLFFKLGVIGFGGPAAHIAMSGALAGRLLAL